MQCPLKVRFAERVIDIDSPAFCWRNQNRQLTDLLPSNELLPWRNNSLESPALTETSLFN
jgi:hypothetical protein